MRRWISIALVCLQLVTLFGVETARAQVDRIRFEVHFDPTFNWLYSDTERYSNKGAQMGFLAGLEVEWVFAKRYSLLVGADVNYHRVGLTYNAIVDQIPRKYYDLPAITTKGTVGNLHSTMLNFPIGLKLRAVEIGYFTLYASVGGMVQIPVTQSISSKNAIPELKKEATKKYFYPINVGVFGRLGVEYALGSRSAMEAGLSYYSVLSPLLRVESGRITAGTLAFRLGFVF